VAGWQQQQLFRQELVASFSRGFMRAWPSSQLVREITAVTAPAARPSTVAPMK